MKAGNGATSRYTYVSEMNHHFVSITITMCFAVCVSSEKSHNEISNVRAQTRPKRIVGGDSMKDRSKIPYKVMEYYVWIGQVWNCYEDGLPWYERAKFYLPTIGLLSRLLQVCTEKKEKLVCGGALIAPRIVQTACHCLANYQVPVKNSVWGTARVNNNWEQRMRIYMGRVDVVTFDYPIVSEKFVVHQKCGQLRLSPKSIRYDIGWIVLEYQVPYTEAVLYDTWGKLDYAGPYRRQAIVDMYNKAVGQRLVCLLVGFGVNEKKRPSRFMRQAWIQILDWVQCYHATYLIRNHSSYYSYNDSASWICAQQLPAVSYNKFRGIHGSGDSGSPITCNNNYVALVTGDTQYKKVRVGFTEMLSETAISCALEANSVESRPDWENMVLDPHFPDPFYMRNLKIPNERALKRTKLKYRHYDYERREKVHTITRVGF